MTTELPLDNDQDVDAALTRKNANTRAVEAATGLTGLTVRLSATDGGAAIHGSLSVPAAEASGLPGTYFGTFQGDDLRAYCGGLVGTIAYVVFGDGTNVLTSEPVLIVERRRPG